MKAKRAEKISDALRRAVGTGGLSRYAIAKRTGLDEGLLSRFVHGKCGLSLESIDLVCEVLGLELRPVRPARRTKRK